MTSFPARSRHFRSQPRSHARTRSRRVPTTSAQSITLVPDLQKQMRGRAGHVGQMRLSDWSKFEILLSDWSVRRPTPCTTLPNRESQIHFPRLQSEPHCRTTVIKE